MTTMRTSGIPAFLVVGSLLIGSTTASDGASKPCTICRNNQAFTRPNKTITIPGFLTQTCQQLNVTASIIFSESDNECGQIQSIGPLCGCPVEDIETKCHLCGSVGEEVGTPLKEVPLFPELFDGITPNCELFQAYLLSVPDNDSLCGVSQALLGSYCNCPSSTGTNETTTKGPCKLCSNGNNVTMPNASSHLGLPGLETCGQVDQTARVVLHQGEDFCEGVQQLGPMCGCEGFELPETPCTLCNDGTMVPNPEKVIPFVDGATFFGGSVGGFSINVTCGLYEAFMRTVPNGDQVCTDAQSISSYCGCPALEDHCQFCPNGERVPEEFLSKELGFLRKEFASQQGAEFLLPTCEFAETLTFQLRPRTDECLIRHRSWLCGCNGGKSIFHGVDTEAKKFWIAWSGRIISIFSLFASFAMAADILPYKQKRGHVYCQLVLGVIVFDVATAVAMALSSLPIVETLDGDPYGMYGARGNMLTCKIQATVLHLGYGSILYNISLGVYYFLVIVYGWREKRLRRAVYALHGVPIILAIIIGFAGIPYYMPGLFSCAISPSPWHQQKWAFTLLTVVPVYGGIMIMIYLLTRIYLKVRADQQRVQRWRTESSRTALISAPSTAELDSTFDRTAHTSPEFTSTQNEVHEGNMKELKASLGLLGREGRRVSAPSTMTTTAAAAATGDERLTLAQTSRIPTQQICSSINMFSANVVARRQEQQQLRQRARLERQVFLQCLNYTLAFVVVFPFSVAQGYYAALRDEGHFVAVLATAALTPAQGILNCFVYFGPRLKCCSWLCWGRGRYESVTGKISDDHETPELPPISSLQVEWEPSIQIASDNELDEETQSSADPSIAFLQFSSQ